MSTIPGTLHDGKIILDAPTDLPEGSRVLVLVAEPGVGSLGIREEDWPKTPEEIEAWVAWNDSREPVELTAEEEEDLRQAREAVKKVTLEAVRRRMEESE